MFFKFIVRNSGKLRRENGVYFASLVISVAAFYVILSLGEQDVMMYLKNIESDAVSKLMLMLPILYVVSLFFVFFLVYFANRYQLQRRSHEFGTYLMMGMKSSRLFVMIMGETLWNGLIALLIGAPGALFLTELISLTTSRLIGMGIIGHQFRISWQALGLTIFGFMLVQLFAMAILSLKMSCKEPVDLMYEQKDKVQKILSPSWGLVSLMLGSALLCTAYVLAIVYLHTLDAMLFALITVVGISGTFMLFRGLGSLIGIFIRRKSSASTGLTVFTGRQLQENVLHQWTSLAVSSLLILLAVICFTYGISTILERGSASGRSADFTFETSEEKITSVLASDELKPFVRDYYTMKFGLLGSKNAGISDNTEAHTFSWEGLEQIISVEDSSDIKENLLNNLENNNRPYLISLSSYNSLLRSINKTPIVLSSDEIAMYSSEQFSFSHDILSKALKSNPTVRIDNKQYRLTSMLYTSNLVADRAVTISYALIVPEDVFNALVCDLGNSPHWNMVLNPDFVSKKGLMQAIQQVDKILDDSGLQYESYLASMGRQLFYIVAGSYITLYLGVMFLIIANTVLGLKFLMQQRSTRRRYYTLAMLGASVKELCSSARAQIRLYFGLVIAVALISSGFGVVAMLRTFLRIPVTSNVNISTVAYMAGAAFIVFIIFELGYIWMIMKKSDEEIMKLDGIQ